MKILYSIALLFLLSTYSLSNDNFNLCRLKISQTSPNLFNLCKPVQPTPNPVDILNKNQNPEKKDLAPFSKNGYNLKNRTVWREIDPRDGQIWWIDEELGVYWRYLREDENPETLQVSQNRVSDFCRT